MNPCTHCGHAYSHLQSRPLYCGRAGAFLHVEPPVHTQCGFQRMGGRLFARLAGTCGERGRYFVPAQDNRQ